MSHQDENDLFRLIVEHNGMGILVTDREGRIVHANPRQLAASGYTLDELVGKTPRLFKSGEMQRDIYESMWATILSGRIWSGDLINRRKNGETVRELVKIAPIRNSAGAITHFFAIKEENLFGKVQQLLGGTVATVDPLTGLPNRAMLLDRLNYVIAQCEQAKESFSLLVIDIDRFRSINETFGHVAADAVLTRVAARLKLGVRDSDTVARIGSNAFVVVSQGSDTEPQLEQMTQRLLGAAFAPIDLNGRMATVTGSIGIVRYPLDAREGDVLLQHADSALAAAKRKGGDGYCFYEPPFQELAKEWGDLSDALRNAARRGELLLEYQPKVDLHSGQIVGIEALVRWQHPHHGVLGPGRFIPLAEETGLIVELSHWVIRSVLQQLRAWRDADGPQIVIGVNLSLRHFRAGDLPGVIATELAATGVDPGLLELEISESAMMRDPTQAFIIVDRIKSLGVRLALDDFGTGLSSLSYLSRMNVDKLKIDQTFVRDIATNPVNASIVAAIIAMAHKLGKRVIAVGVETEGQALQLRRYDCDEIQGFYFSHPCGIAEIQTLLGNGRSLTLRHEPQTEKTLLLVDDEPSILSALNRLLRREGYRILTAENGAAAMQVLAAQPVHVIVSDQRMPGMTGIELLSQVRELYPDTRRIILSGYSDIGTLTEAINRGAVWKYIAKPWDDEMLKAAIRQAFDLAA